MRPEEVVEMLKMGTPVLVAMVAYLVNVILKMFPKYDTKWSPLVNIGVGIVSFAIAIPIGLVSTESPLMIFAGLASCLISALGAGGFYDLIQTKINQGKEVL